MLKMYVSPNPLHCEHAYILALFESFFMHIIKHHLFTTKTVNDICITCVDTNLFEVSNCVVPIGVFAKLQ